MDNSHLQFTPETIGHLLADRWLTVPAYQRPYAWVEDNVEDFWKDLEGAVAANGEYFLGAIVITSQTDRNQIIDGQQRLATASLLLAAIRDELLVLGEEALGSHVEQRYLRSFQPGVDSVLPRLELAPDDASFYRSRFLDRSGKEPETASQRRLLAAFDRLRGHVEMIDDGSPENARKRALSNWVEHLEKHVLVVLVTAASEGDAFQIFETLNDRGAPLTIADLLKNYLISRDPDQALVIQGAWDEALEHLGTTIETQTLVTFIRTYWSSLYGATRERDLYKSLRTRVTDGHQALNLAGELGHASELYAAADDPDHPLWNSQEAIATQAIDTLLYFQLAQYRPLLLAAMDAFHEDEIASLLKALVSWSFRGLIFGGIGGGTTERAYAQAAVSIRQGRVEGTHDIFNALRPIIPGDEDFRAAFESAVLQRPRIAHYVARCLERYLSNKPNASLDRYPEKLEWMSAPLLPRKADPDEWRRFAREDIARYVNRIGNLVAVPIARQKIPASFSERLQFVGQVGSELNKSVALETWSPEAIRHRQQDLASLAVRIWPRSPGINNA